MTTNATTLTTPSAGAVLAFGQLNLSMSCPAGTYTCSFTADLYVDGVAVTGSAQSGTVGQGTTQSYPLDMFCVLKNVPSGSHTVTVGWKSSSTNHASWFSQSGFRSTAVLIGDS